MSDSKKETARIEAFSDGVFAIAITLLILEIKVPDVHEIGSIKDLWRALYDLWPSYFAFVFSFGSILVAWVNHHHVFNEIKGTSRPFIYANGFLLLTITFIPFPTALLAEYIRTDFLKPAIVFYCFSNLLCTLAWYMLGRSVVRPRPLIEAPDKNILFQQSMRSVRIGLMVSSATLLLSYFMPLTALIINFIILIVWVIFSLNDHPENRIFAG